MLSRFFSKSWDRARGAFCGWRLGYQALWSDPLTGLWSRFCFEQFGHREVERRAKSDIIAVVSFDVNGFKGVNDSRGHQAGDKLLRLLALCIRWSLRRKTDVPFRFGGDEFVVFLSGADKEVARAYGECVKQAFLGVTHAMLPGLPKSFGLSFGVELMTKDDALLTVLEKSDVRMYADKASQRAS